MKRGSVMLCYYCMKEKGDSNVCGYCGHTNEIPVELHQLRPGTVLDKKYVVGRVLGEGGFGITYIGIDTMLRSKSIFRTDTRYATAPTAALSRPAPAVKITFIITAYSVFWKKRASSPAFQTSPVLSTSGISLNRTIPPTS